MFGTEIWHVAYWPGTCGVQGWHVRCRTYMWGARLTCEVLFWHVGYRYLTWWKHVKYRYPTCCDMWGTGNSRVMTCVLQVLHAGCMKPHAMTREVLPSNWTISFDTWVTVTSSVLKGWQTPLACWYYNHQFVKPFEKWWIVVDKYCKSAKMPWDHNIKLSYWSLSFCLSCLFGISIY